MNYRQPNSFGSATMSRFVQVLSAGILISGIFGGIALMPAPADAAKVSKEEKALLRKAATECKAQAKADKLGWRARRKFVKSCVTGKLSQHPGVDVQRLLSTYPDLENLPKTDVKDPM